MRWNRHAGELSLIVPLPPLVRIRTPDKYKMGDEMEVVRIYRLRNKDESDFMYYVGRTKLTLEERFQQHIRASIKVKCRDWDVYAHIRKMGGFDNFYMELLHEFETDNDLDAAEAEDIAIDMFAGMLNMKRAYCTEEEEKKTEAEHNQRWRRTEKGRKCKVDGSKRYRDNQDTGGKRIDCICGGHYKRYVKATHLKTQKHRAWDAAQVNQATLD